MCIKEGGVPTSCNDARNRFSLGNCISDPFFFGVGMGVKITSSENHLLPTP